MAERRKSAESQADTVVSPPILIRTLPHRERHPGGEPPSEDTIAMPRPTAAQLAYGSCTVIFSTLAMLLLSQTSSGLGIALITLSALALGLLVAVTVPLPTPTPSAAAPTPAPAPAPVERVPVQRETASVSAAAAPEPVREPAGP
ncbi:hypothetical protein GCM10011579_011580 [Streptomyces albiflavescens]|uniref:Uncharacterized protein n=2 Tax=Streptomyces albiflavescens TaxID=1623582 RepID=A0A917XTP8_9ACTN|nr:hypothetical protein GCM10011579_011580 [Streptomyces albiflavescens]